MKGRALLYPLSLLYGVGIALWDFSWKFRKTKNLGVPVISIGNLSAGGSGKTPLTIYLARKLRERGYRPAILIRGYRRKSKKDIFLTGRTLSLPSVEETGDEPYLIFFSLQGEVPVGIGARREKIAEFLLRTEKPDLFLLDDGFQYRILGQDLKIVILDAESLKSPRWLLPAGNWREPIKSLRRADLVLYNFKFQAQRDLNLKAELPPIPVFKMFYRAVALSGLGQRKSSPEGLSGKRVFAFAGIAQPESFLRALKMLGAELVGYLLFPDHHWYDRGNIERIKKEAENKNAEFIITTEKDLIKLGNAGKDFLALAIEPRIEREPDFWKHIDKILPPEPSKTENGKG